MEKTFYKQLFICICAAAFFLAGCGAKGKAEEETETVGKTPGAEDEAETPADTAADKEAALLAYMQVLDVLAAEHRLPGGMELGTDGIYEDDNQYAIYDVDGDGKEELLIRYTSTYTAGMTAAIYGYDEASGEVREELLEYPSLTFYDNKMIRADLSHNHGLGPDIWPYSLYAYNEDSDSYDFFAGAQAWQKEFFPEDYDGNPFPDEADRDGDGVVYFIQNQAGENSAPMDGDEYDRWLDGCVGNAGQAEIPWEKLNERGK